MPRLGYVYDPLYLEHGTNGHPENPGRLRAIMTHLEGWGYLDKMEPLSPRDASPEELTLVHSHELIAGIQRVAESGGAWLDRDTYVVPRSYEAAVRAAGGALVATDAMLDGHVDSAFCLVRPPGHHATPQRAMGFCLFNNVALAAAHALESRGLERVAIVDFDVHHGNGTQDAFYADPRVLYVSPHQHPFYPGTGMWEETGAGAGAGMTINVPLPRGCGSREYAHVQREVVAPALRRFRPQLLLVSAGFDAHLADPLAQMLLDTRGYYETAAALVALAGELCEGRVLFALEGGYDPTALAWSVRACIDALLGNEFAEDPIGPGPSVSGPDIDGLIEDIKRAHGL